MKRHLFSVLTLWCFCLLVSAQHTANVTVNTKMGKPTSEELSMTVYAPDSSAQAVVLYKSTAVDYDWGGDNFRIIYSYKKRIKVLKEEGTSQANINIVYFKRKDNRTLRETVEGLDAYAYNLENGKMVRTKMTKEQIFEERLNDAYVQLKFTVPQVKVGTIIEYEYRLTSDLYYQIRDWIAQESIPVLQAEFKVLIPEYFRFNVGSHGIAALEGESKNMNKTFLFGTEKLTCSAEQKTFTGKELPAIEDDAYVWCADNYAAQVNMEFLGYEIPGMIYKYFTQTWEQIDEMLLEDSDFGGRMRMDNPLKEEMAALNLGQFTNVKDKISAIYKLLKDKVKWNERYAFYGKSGRQILKDGTGNNADINFMLISMLNDAGISAFPVLMSRCDQRMLPHAYPSIEKLSTFVVGIAENDSSLVFLDSSVRDGYLDVLPTVLMTDRARLLIPGNSQWLNLQYVGKHAIRRTIRANIQPDGKVTGSRMTFYYGQNAADIRKAFRTAKDSTTFVSQLGTNADMTVTAYTAKGLDEFSNTVRENITFEKQATTGEGFIYINPMVFAHLTENPFKQSERKLPVEFAHTETYDINVVLTIPEGYVVDELPESTKMSFSDGNISMLYFSTQQGNQVTLKYSFSINELTYSPEHYGELKKFWELMTEKNNAIMVLKKL